jgi:hypothetical protein
LAAVVGGAKRARSRKAIADASAELRTLMIFLIANMENKISSNSLKTLGKIFSNREFLRVSHSPARILESRKTEPLGLRECAKILGSAKGEFALV